MNLVAKEYVASRRDCRGVLILSETAGAAQGPLEALIVNPNDESGVAEAIHKALTMSEEEQCRRITRMQNKLRQHDVVKWAVDFIQAMAVAHADNKTSVEPVRRLDGEALEEVAAQFAGARRRLVVLDYDGTLVPHYPYAYQAVPDPDLKRLLSDLATLPETYVVVVSGRGRDFLESWLGDLPIFLAVERGAYIKEPGGGWTPLFPFDMRWKNAVRKIMEDFVALAPRLLRGGEDVLPSLAF
jgi:trehalose 6-phosphate synthase/phosphatase